MATTISKNRNRSTNLKAFWNRYGNLISWVLIVALGSLAA